VRQLAVARREYPSSASQRALVPGGLLRRLTPSDSSSRASWPAVFGVVLALVAGAGLRLVWPADIEYKADEVWTFEHSRDANLSWLGMPSSVDIPNPGMSLWVFVGLQRLCVAEDPPALARAIQCVNILALVLLAGFAFRHVPHGEREPWLWAVALVAVNPLAVLFHRKIWPPCVLPILTLLMLYGWWYRQRRFPAFLWGLVGVCLGQIHMAGFFFAGGFVLWALLFDRPRQRIAWASWLLGSVLGALPMLPWLIHLLAHPGGHPLNPHRWVHACELKFWIRWFTESFGLGIDYTFGPYIHEFQGYPLLGGHPTYLVLLLHWLLGGIAVVLLARAVVNLWRERGHWRVRFMGRSSASAFTQNAALWGFGLLLTLSSFSIHRHYMIVLFPLEFLWVARLALASGDAPARSLRVGRVLLFCLWLAQFLLSANMLGYIHTRQNLSDAEYGIPYGAQCEAR
jgi:4-amino-4-deoxy-L-arabinose transferase-like glycosyltransferase